MEREYTQFRATEGDLPAAGVLGSWGCQFIDSDTYSGRLMTGCLYGVS